MVFKITCNTYNLEWGDRHKAIASRTLPNLSKHYDDELKKLAVTFPPQTHQDAPYANEIHFGVSCEGKDYVVDVCVSFSHKVDLDHPEAIKAVNQLLETFTELAEVCLDQVLSPSNNGTAEFKVVSSLREFFDVMG